LLLLSSSTNILPQSFAGSLVFSSGSGYISATLDAVFGCGERIHQEVERK
jgi:hypothetical protein